MYTPLIDTSITTNVKLGNITKKENTFSGKIKKRRTFVTK